MSEKLYEQLSRLMDDDLPEDELELLMKQVEKSPELLDKFQRYNLIKDSVQKEPSSLVSIPSVVSSVREAIDGEELNMDAIKSINSWRKRKGVMKKVIRPFVGAAIAASVAAVSIVIISDPGNGVATTQKSQIADYQPTSNNGVITVNDRDTTNFNTPGQNSNRINRDGIRVVSLNENGTSTSVKQHNRVNVTDKAVNEMQWESMSPELRKKINRYVTSHRQYPANHISTSESSRVVRQKASGE